MLVRMARSLRHHMNNHGFDINSKDADEKPIGAHFCQQHHTLIDLSVTTIDHLHLPFKPRLGPHIQ